MSGLTLRVVWPIHDDAMFEQEAITKASSEWPDFAEANQVTIVGPARIKVIRLDAHQQQSLDATRAVVCEAPVTKRISLTERTAA